MTELAARNGWARRRLRDAVTKLVDGSHNPPPKQDRGRPMLSARNVDQGQIIFDDFRYISDASFETEHARTRVSPGDVLLTIVGTIGRSAVVPNGLGPFALQRSVAVLAPKEDLLPKFLAYQLQSPRIQRHFEEHARGTAQKGVYLKTLGETPLVVPPISEQNAIVAEIEKQFSRLDEAVANLKRVKANLKRYKAAVLKAAVEGRLVPTEVELARRESRTLETGAQLLERIAPPRARPAKARPPVGLMTEGNGEALKALPEGWSITPLGRVTTLVEYGSSAKTGETNVGVPVLRMGNIVDGELDLSTLKYLPDSHEEFPRLLLDEGDLLFNRTNSPELVGKTAVFKGRPAKCSFASYLIRVRMAHGLLPDFISAFINSIYGRRWVKAVATQQVGQANVNGTKLQNLLVPVPPRAEQERIVAELGRRLSLAANFEAAIAAELQRAGHLEQAVLGAEFGWQGGGR